MEMINIYFMGKLELSPTASIALATALVLLVHPLPPSGPCLCFGDRFGSRGMNKLEEELLVRGC